MGRIAGAVVSTSPINTPNLPALTPLPSGTLKVKILKNRNIGKTASGQPLIVNANGFIYASYVPCKITKLFEDMLACDICNDRDITVKSTILQSSSGAREINVCNACKRTHKISDFMFVFEHDELFPEINPRETDNIVWRIGRSELVYPLMLTAHANGKIEVGLVKKPTILDRDYLCHDDFLYEVHPFNTSRLIGQPPYAYRFPKPIYDGQNYMIGFMTDGRYLSADYVEFEDDDTDE